ncbi:MAG: hypothetical protein JSR64_17395 [Nitrospira sp.]|nr:hypothetical protein [Nitrospira sp.]
MTVDELLDWMGSHACLVELEQIWGEADRDYRHRWGRPSENLQAADWMVGRLLEEIRALDGISNEKRHLLFDWPKIAVPRIASELDQHSGECIRLSTHVRRWAVEEVRGRLKPSCSDQ